MIIWQTPIYKDTVLEGYVLSNTGHLIKLPYITKQKHKMPYRCIKGTIDNDGYLKVTLRSEDIEIQTCIHRLVAYTFIPNPNNYPVINHKDENKLNNNVDNLEWCTSEYNNSYGTINQRRSITHKRLYQELDEEGKRKVALRNKINRSRRK